MNYQVLVIGGGLSGLTAASLLSKRGLKVAVIDKSYNPGGSCGIFKRNDAIFDQGAAMMFGFGEKGFNAHRFVFNCLEESVDVIKHKQLYCMNFKGHRIKFYDDVAMFSEELAKVFPTQRQQIMQFYKDIGLIYQHVMVENPNYTSPDETQAKDGIKGILKHPISYIRFLSYLNKSSKSLLLKYFDDPEILKFFDKLTSTYCYTTVTESPAILAAVMFVDNHFGGSYYPCGSTLFIPGKLEKAIEENGGEMLLNKEVIQILFNQQDRPCGVLLKDGTKLYAEHIIYSGTVWNLYGKLIEKGHLSKEEMEWAAKQIPTYPSVVLYAKVNKEVIPEDTLPIEMLVGNPDMLDESEITVYITSIDDKTLCDDHSHIVMAIGPTFEKWDRSDASMYQKKKQKEAERLLDVLEKRFPGFKKGVQYSEVATPLTIERYTNKNGGAVAGPKQMLGQHMFKRMHIRSRWPNLYCCGESTVLGTGTPTVTTSGLSAANALLKKLKLPPFVYQKNQKNFIRVHEKPMTIEQLYDQYLPLEKSIMHMARECQYCEHPTCSRDPQADIRGIMRRVTVGNFIGAKKLASLIGAKEDYSSDLLNKYETRCIKMIKNKKPVAIKSVVEYLLLDK